METARKTRQKRVTKTNGRKRKRGIRVGEERRQQNKSGRGKGGTEKNETTQGKSKRGKFGGKN